MQSLLSPWGGMDDEEKSAVIGKMGMALIQVGPVGAQAALDIGGTHSKNVHQNIKRQL